MNVIMVTFRTLLSHYVYHKNQTAFLLLGLILGVALWSAVQIINGHAKASYAQADQLLGAQASDWIYSQAGSIDVEDYVKLRRAGWRQIYPVMEKRLSTKDGTPLTLIATDLMSLPSANTPQLKGDDLSLWRSLFQIPYGVMIPSSIANKLNIREGQRIQLRDGTTLPPAIIASYTQQGQRLFMDIGAAAIVFNTPNPSYLVSSSLSAQQRDELDIWLQDNSPSLYRVENQQPLDLSQLTKSLHTHLSAMSLLAFSVGLFIVFNAVRFSLYTRRSTFAILRELGVEDKHIIIAIVLEAIILSLIGSALGLVSGYSLSQVLLPSMAATLQNLYGAVLSQSIILSSNTIIGAWLLTLFGLGLALVTPLIQQARQTSQQTINLDKNWKSEITHNKKLALYAILGLTVAALSYPWLDSLLHGFTLLAILLFAGAALLPYMIHFLLHRFRHHSVRSQQRTGIQHWQWSDGMTQLTPMRTAYMAMLLALTANMGVDSLVNSFKTSLDTWLQQRIAADIYIHKESEIPLQTLLALPWVEDHHVRNGLSLRWPTEAGRPTLIRGLDPNAPDVMTLPMAQTLYKTNNNSGGQWSSTHTHPSILANEQVKYLAGYQLGDSVVFNRPTGEQKTFTITGFYHDYGNPYFQFYLPFSEVESTWSKARPQGIALWISEDAKQDKLDWQNDLIDLGLQPGDWIDRRSILKISMNIFDRTFAMTAAINSLTFLVAGIALLLSLLALHEKRLPTYAHWRSMGVYWREWLAICGKPYMIALLVTWLLSIPLGSALAWLLIHDINVLSFGWTMALKWQWQSALWLGLLCILVSAIAFIFAALKVKYKLPSALKQLGQDQ